MTNIPNQDTLCSDCLSLTLFCASKQLGFQPGHFPALERSQIIWLDASGEKTVKAPGLHQRLMDSSNVNFGADARTNRRTFAGKLAFCAMAGGLVAGYGGLGAVAARYLFPAKPTARRWLFVAELSRLRAGDSVLYTAPNGARVNIARQGNAGTVEDFIALSSTCPHLGCQVHWEAQNKRFFCPCHNGVFTPAGKGIGGPPGEAGQSLPRYLLKIEKGLLLIEVPVEKLG